jgi:hypothetical protein
MPTPVITNTQLGWAFQTSFLNNVKPKASFLTQLVFGGRETILPTESVELSYREGERFLAPFVEVNAEAIPVGSRSTVFANVSTPNIRIKRPMDAYQAFLRRQPATGMFISGGGPVSAARAQAIADDSLFMSELIDNRIEWMVGQLISGTTDGKMVLSYETDPKNANWRIEIPRATDVDITLTTTARWNDSAPNAQNDFLNVKRLLAKHVNAPPTVCLMDSAAANAFLNLSAVKADLDRRNVDAGTLALQSQFTEAGAIYHGTYMGIPVWEYTREYVDETGTTRLFLGGGTTAAGLAIFMAQGALNDSTIYYGCIPDHDAFETGSFVGKRFAKAWKTQDPSVYTQLVQSRPLPFIRRPNAVVVMDVL